MDRIASGGTAAVYLAEDRVLGRKVALKLLHNCFADDEEFVERFRREASIAARLRHRHIVAVFDRGQWEGIHYIAMEYVSGRSLNR
jgi:eukaryotic-like serine/threonine-protein kinase